MNGLEKIDTPYGSFLSFPNDLITNQLRRYGAHQRNELAMLLALVHPGDIVIDVGANIGTFAIPLAVRVGDDGHVYAFEADEEIFRVLMENIALNQRKNITAVNAIVSEKSGGYRKTQRVGNRGATSFYLDKSGSMDSTSVVSIDYYYKTNFIKGQKVDVVKIDVEGMDVDVLFSCEVMIKKHKPIIYIEISSKQLLQHGHSSVDIEVMLEDLGYHFFRNTGQRNSSNDKYRIAQLPNLRIAGGFFDLLAVHPTNRRYPLNARSRHLRWLGTSKNQFSGQSVFYADDCQQRIPN